MSYVPLEVAEDLVNGMLGANVMTLREPSVTVKCSIGDISKIEIPVGLPYAAALERIKGEARGIGVTIDLNSFYSETPVELHNFVSRIIYRFLVVEGTKVIAYYIEDRDFYICSYREIDYSGLTMKDIPEDIARRSDNSLESQAAIRYANSILGIWRPMVASFKK